MTHSVSTPHSHAHYPSRGGTSKGLLGAALEWESALDLQIYPILRYDCVYIWPYIYNLPICPLGQFAIQGVVERDQISDTKKIKYHISHPLKNHNPPP